MNKFKFDSIKIEKKKYLIEASAGTGKTHSMGQIFIRLIIEGFSPEKILLVTFTNAAAEEIKERILIFLIEVKSYLKDGDIEKINKIKNDKDLLNYLKNIREDKDLEKRIKYIDNAIFNFDKIYTCTIHSFAINLVKEFSNEIGLPFVNEFGKSSKNIDNLILQKYLLEKYITSRNYLEKLLKSIKDKEDKEKLKKIIKELKKVKDFYENFKVSPNKNLDKNIESAKNPSNKNNDEVIDNLYSLKEDFLKFYSLNSLNIKKKYGIFNFNDSMELLLNLFNSNESIRKKISDRFDLLIIDEFQDSDENQVKLFETLFSGKTVFYIGDPKQAIYGFRGGDFINYLNIKKNIPEDCQYILNQSYRSTAKVIDFINQFSEIIFNESKKENESEDDQENEIEIDKSKVEKNKKNSKKINKEDNAEKIIREIKDLLKYEKVESAIQESKGKTEAKLIKITKDEETNETNEKNIEKEKSKASKKLDYIENKKVAFWIKEKIEELQYEDSEFKYENTAILLKNNDDIDKFYKFFTEFGLPCALKQQKSVFETDEAIFIYYLLSAILNKDDIKYIKRLLSTPYFDYTYDEIIKKIGIIYPDYLYVLRYLHECWKELGIYSIFENIFLRFKLNIKGFTIYDYERKLTNIRQIFEVLTNYFEKKNLSLYDQIEILKELIKGEDEDFDKDFDDISSMRIESEENAIIISTIHSAKGLEYDTVFCPNIDFNSKNKYPAIFYYKKNNEFYKGYILDSTTPKNNEIDYNELKDLYKGYHKIQDDNLRYVAITRAKNRLYPFIIKEKSTKDGFDPSNLAESLKGKGYLSELNLESINIIQVFDQIEKDFNKINDGNFEDKKDSYENDKDEKDKNKNDKDENVKPTQNILRKDLSKEEIKEIPEVDLKEFDSKVEKIYSYSSISHLREKVVNAKEVKKDFQDIVIEFNPYTDQYRIDFEEKYSDFKGRFAGNIFHGTMEKLILEYKDLFENPFGENVEKIKKISQKMVKKYFISEKIVEKFADENLNLVLNTLKTKIPFSEDRIYQLKNLYPEVEFFAKAKEKNINEFYKICKKDSESSLVFDEELIIKGYFKGFVDLIFIEDNKLNFIDWKTNDLSQYLQKENIKLKKDIIDENQEISFDILEREVVKSNYDIQYNLYASVLYKFIKSNNLPYEFGNVYYFFVRYINENNNNAVFVKQFDKNQIEELSKNIIEVD